MLCWCLMPNNKVRLILLLKVINILSFNTKILKFMIYLTNVKILYNIKKYL